MANPEQVCAVVVTHDRREMLRECLTALAGQTRPPDEILVVDNGSHDGTGAMLTDEFPDVVVHRLAENQGGAGGFHEGLKVGHRNGFEWLWVMDDDTIPTPTALESLLEGSAAAAEVDDQPLVLASQVLWTDGRLHPMNTAVLGIHRMNRLLEGVERGLLRIRAASFVSLLINRRAVERFGLPIKRYFIWCDDVEFTARVLRTEPGYLVPSSVVHHKTATAYTSAEGSPERFFYYVRNSLYMMRGDAWDTQEKLRILWVLMIHIRQFFIANRWRPRAALTVARAILHGLVTPADDGDAARLSRRRLQSLDVDESTRVGG
jgi:rhamnopyranosyl-N-acetylglucosaminyl-diphospho-decaprenol beta-1,3/1,4-galactofuranosyltransferase